MYPLLFAYLFLPQKRSEQLICFIQIYYLPDKDQNQHLGIDVHSKHTLFHLLAIPQQKVTMDKSGDFVSLTAGKTAKVADKTTGKFFVDSKDVKYPIYVSVNDKLFYLKTAKSGNIYKVYVVAK